MSDTGQRKRSVSTVTKCGPKILKQFKSFTCAGPIQWTMQHHPSHKRSFALQIVPEGANSSCVTGGYLTACLDFQCDQLTGLFQNEIHFVPRSVAPEVQLALLWIEGAPCLDGLKQSLLQPESRVHGGRYIRGRLDSGEPDRKAAIRPEQLRRFDERRRGIGLAGLASDRQHRDGPGPKGRLEIATRPVQFHFPQIMKQIISRGDNEMHN